MIASQRVLGYRGREITCMEGRRTRGRGLMVLRLRHDARASRKSDVVLGEHFLSASGCPNSHQQELTAVNAVIHKASFSESRAAWMLG